MPSGITPSQTCTDQVSTFSPMARDPRSRLRSAPKGVKKARLKHQCVSVHEAHQAPESLGLPKEPNVLSRFLSLPGEVRNRVYRLLLVQPCKFDMYHGRDCKLLVCDERVGPRFAKDRWWMYRCAECGTHHSNGRSLLPSWQAQHRPIFVSPARSQWAKPNPNEYLCDKCYCQKFGRLNRPSMSALPCLCSRRQNLQVLLINRRIHAEASYIFWTENHFAFENVGLLEGFLFNLRPETRGWLTRISLMAHPGFEPSDSSNLKLEKWETLRDAWRMLQQCTGLVALELDAAFLSKPRYVRGMRRLQAKRRVSFVRHSVFFHSASDTPERYIWPTLAFRQPVTSIQESLLKKAIVENLALSMQGTRRMRARHLRALFQDDSTSGVPG